MSVRVVSMAADVPGCIALLSRTASVPAAGYAGWFSARETAGVPWVAAGVPVFATGFVDRNTATATANAATVPDAYSQILRLFFFSAE